VTSHGKVVTTGAVPVERLQDRCQADVGWDCCAPDEQSAIEAAAKEFTLPANWVEALQAFQAGE
jgi:hypothetical protein